MVAGLSQLEAHCYIKTKAVICRTFHALVINCCGSHDCASENNPIINPFKIKVHERGRWGDKAGEKRGQTNPCAQKNICGWVSIVIFHRVEKYFCFFAKNKHQVMLQEGGVGGRG
ncbi:hypothetical protein CDAR_168591 [Caerostris darwini]|uniref:Uncharacterized protein n=1 Tax=Caerostris darwini TaxID=1538125 RepID=A0AAV4T491_9ARAC|nr:hypothetical protein CDAR_168591 [Caerostris darwini]